MPTLEELIRLASKAPRKAAKARGAALWPMPSDPTVLADMIQTMDFAGATTIEAKILAVYQHRQASIWAYLTLKDGKHGPWPWAAALPKVFDPHHLLGRHEGDWLDAHWAYDYFPAPAGGLQHRIDIVDHVFRRHGVAASLLPAAP